MQSGDWEWDSQIRVRVGILQTIEALQLPFLKQDAILLRKEINYEEVGEQPALEPRVELRVKAGS